MNSNTIILLANGKGTRFKSNFNDSPKPLIKYKDEELITWSLKALKTFFKTQKTFFFSERQAPYGACREPKPTSLTFEFNEY